MNGSSPLRAIRLSYTYSRRPGAVTPLMMKGLRLSKVPSVPSTSRPPLRGIGIDVGEMLKPGGMLRRSVHGDAVHGLARRRLDRAQKPMTERQQLS